MLKTLRLATASLVLMAGLAQAEPVRIAIASFGEHPALNEVADGFKARMTELGQVEGKDVVYSFDHANFDRTLVPQVLQKVEASKPALALLITTGLNQAAVRGIRDKSIPIVFGSVVDPVVAGIVPDWKHGSETTTGASMMPEFDGAMAFLKQVMPSIKSVGTLFNPGEDNDQTNIELMQKAADAAGLKLVAVPVEAPADLPQRVQSLKGRADAIFLIQSNIVQTAVPVVAQTAQRAGLPLFNSVYSEELKDQIAGFYAISYRKNGEHAADIADRILKGEKPADIPSYVPTPDDFEAVVSRKGMQAAGLEIPAALAGSPWLKD